MQYRMGIGLLLFGILLANISSDVFIIMGITAGFAGLLFIMGSCAKEKKEDFQNSINQEGHLNLNMEEKK